MADPVALAADADIRVGGPVTVAVAVAWLLWLIFGVADAARAGVAPAWPVVLVDGRAVMPEDLGR